MLYDWISKVGFFLSSSYHNKTLHLPGLHCDHVLPFFFFFLISTCMKFIILLTIKWMKHIPRTPEKRPAKAIWWRAAGGTSSGCCGCCPCPRGVKSFAVEHCDLWPLSLCPLCLLIGASRWALWTEKKNYVSFPLSGVVVNIRLLVSLASSEGVRLDPPCAKKKTRKERKRF